MSRIASECKFCGDLGAKTYSGTIDARHSVLNKEFTCGSIQEIQFPCGTVNWTMHCQGSTSQRLANTRKLPDK